MSSVVPSEYLMAQSLSYECLMKDVLWCRDASCTLWDFMFSDWALDCPAFALNLSAVSLWPKNAIILHSDSLLDGRISPGPVRFAVCVCFMKIKQDRGEMMLLFCHKSTSDSWLKSLMFGRIMFTLSMCCCFKLTGGFICFPPVFNFSNMFNGYSVCWFILDGYPWACFMFLIEHMRHCLVMFHCHL